MKEKIIAAVIVALALSTGTFGKDVNYAINNQRIQDQSSSLQPSDTTNIKALLKKLEKTVMYVSSYTMM